MSSHTTPTSSPTKERRRAITDAERKAIRDHWATADQKPHKAVQAWFTETHYHTISQSTVSEILSSRYDYLDKLLELVSDSLLAPIFATTTDDNSILETTGIV
jgi:hypothetical protein